MVSVDSSLDVGVALTVGVGDGLLLVGSSVGVAVTVAVAVVAGGLETMVRVAVAVVAGGVVADGVVADGVVAGGVVADGTSLELLAEGPAAVRLMVGKDRLPVGSGRLSPPSQPASIIPAVSAQTPTPTQRLRPVTAMVRGSYQWILGRGLGAGRRG
jgi:hypothetical protein